jgi:competence CoiA-like predicted nuclease
MESLAHLKIKQDLYWALVKNGYNVEMEKILTNRYQPDLTIKVNNKTVAVEIQKSPIGCKTLFNRMQSHTKAGAHTLWLIPEDILCSIIYKKKWCELIQRIQYGMVFIPKNDCRIQPARIENYFNSKKRYIDYYESMVEIDDLIMEHNPENNLNITVWHEWWLESYLEIYG